MSNNSYSTLTILGSTGSIGTTAIELIKLHQDKFSVISLTSYNNIQLLANQAKQLNAKYAVIGNESLYKELKDALAGTNIEALAGEQAIIDAAKITSDIVLTAIVGAAGLLPTMAAIERGATIALANKETLVCAGDIVMQAAKTHNAKIIPVDSEHSAIFQVFDFNNPSSIEKIIVTASGGPFRNFTKQQIENATLADALKHPIWNMGAKISIDSATMMNKSLEIIEAWHLFPIEKSQLEILVHPQSIIHSMVNYVDGSVLAQLGTPDMSTPIAYALAYPERMTSNSSKLNLAEIGNLSFFAPDYEKFPALRLGKEALQAGGSAPSILNAANEIAVERFLNQQISFGEIAQIVEKTLEKIPVSSPTTIDEVIAIDRQARQIAGSSFS